MSSSGVFLAGSRNLLKNSSDPRLLKGTGFSPYDKLFVSSNGL